MKSLSLISFFSHFLTSSTNASLCSTFLSIFSFSSSSFLSVDLDFLPSGTPCLEYPGTPILEGSPFLLFLGMEVVEGVMVGLKGVSGGRVRWMVDGRLGGVTLIGLEWGGNIFEMIGFPLLLPFSSMGNIPTSPRLSPPCPPCPSPRQQHHQSYHQSLLDICYRFKYQQAPILDQVYR